MSNKEEQLQKLGEQITNDVKQGKKPTIINKFLKNFFFSALKSKKEIKDVEKEIGSLETVTLIISQDRNILRAQSKKGKEDIPMTNEEVQKFCKNFNVKEESVKACKSIFVQLNFLTKVISIQQNKLDGTTTNLYI